MNTSPTSLFDSYEQDFRQFIDTIREKLENGGSDDRSDQRKTILRRVEMELDEADEMVSQMELEIQGIPQSVRVHYHARLRSAKADLLQYKKQLKDQNAQVARSDLLSSSQPFATSDEPYGSNNDRTRLLNNTTLLEDGTRRLQDSQRIALETESQGADILMNLRTQREQIENARGTLNTADSSIDRASSTLNKMIRQMFKQRIVTVAIIIVLVLLIGIIIWEKLS